MKVKLGQTDLVLHRGDLTECDVDAIVNAANSQLWMGAGVAGAIKRKGGTIIEEEAMRLGPVEVGEAVVTIGGNLPAAYVIHAAAMGPDLRTDAQKIVQATRSSLKRAEELRLSTVAFPAFGTGVGGFPAHEAAEAMLRVFLDHFTQGGTTLRRVEVVLFQDESLKAFVDVLRRLHPSAP